MICPMCGTEFTSKYSNKVYCSKKCADKYARKNTQKSVCKLCGKEFIRNQKHKFYCSDECHKKARKPLGRYHSYSLDRKCKEWGIDYGKKQAEETLAMVGRVIV